VLAQQLGELIAALLPFALVMAGAVAVGFVLWLLLRASSRRRGKMSEKQRGQSLVEFLLFLPVFLVIITGIFELGFFFLSYVDLLDASREGARFGVDLDPASAYPDWNCATTTNFYVAIACYAEESFGKPLNPSNGYDDVVVTAYVVQNGSVSFRYPDFERYGNKTSRFSNADVNEFAKIGPCAQGFVIVEMFYRHRQMLGLPLWTWAVPDPIDLYSFTVMPNATATTQTVCPP